MSLVFNSFCFENRMCSGLWGTQKGRPCSWPPDSFWSKTSRNPTAIHSIQGHQSCQRGLSLRHSIHGGEIWGQMHPSSGPREWAPWGQLSSAEEAVLCEGNHEKQGLPWAWVETSSNEKEGLRWRRPGNQAEMFPFGTMIVRQPLQCVITENSDMALFIRQLSPGHVGEVYLFTEQVLTEMRLGLSVKGRESQ